MQVLGQWVVLTKTINLLPRGGVIALNLFDFGKQKEIGVRDSGGNNKEKFSKPLMQLLKEVQGLYNPWEKSLFLSHHWRHWYYGLYLVCDTWSWLCCWRMWSCLQRPKGSSLLWEAGLEQAADNSNLVCLKGMLFKYSVNYKILTFFHSRHSTIRISSNEARFPNPIWPSLSVLLPLLCGSRHLCLSGVAAPKPLPLQL